MLAFAKHVVGDRDQTGPGGEDSGARQIEMNVGKKERMTVRFRRFVGVGKKGGLDDAEGKESSRWEESEWGWTGASCDSKVLSQRQMPGERAR